MKRSKKIALALMATSALTLTACEEQVPVDIYSDVEQCISKEMNEDKCQDTFQEALNLHEESGPRYESKDLCEEEFGHDQCYRAETASGSSGHFMPFLAGYMIGNITGNNSYSSISKPVYNHGGKYVTQDGSTIFKNSKGQFTTYRSSITYKSPPAQVMTRSTISSKGGFGARVSAGG